MTIELEKLEVIIEANAEKIEKNLAKVMPTIEKMMKRMGITVEKETEKIEKGLDISKTESKLERQIEQLNTTFKKQLAFMEKQAEKSSGNIGVGLSKGVAKGRKNISKDIDAMINEINAKMGQAKAQQEKIAFLKAQRQGSVESGNTKNQIKYDDQIATAQAQLTKYHEAAKKLARSMKEEFDTLPQELDSIANKMAQNEAQIEHMRSRIKSMKTEYLEAKTPSGSFENGFKGTEDNRVSLKIQEKILRQSAKMNKLVQDNDALQRAYAMVEDRSKSLAPAIAKINTQLKKQTRQTETAGSGMRKFGRNIEQSRGAFSRMKLIAGGIGLALGKGFRFATRSFNRFKNHFSRGSSQIQRRTNKMSQGFSHMGRRIGRIVKQVFIFSLIYHGLRMMGRGLMSALQTNEEFSQSLNQIKVNLLTAFYPIYTAILPAINALMSALAKVTGYIASFIATLFGTTYSAAKQGATGLYQNIQAMNETGTAADKNKKKIKEMQRSLMGFDEINKLSLNNKDDNDSSLDTPKRPGIDFGAATGDYAPPAWMESFMNTLQDFFKPFQAAWNNQGKKVIDAWNYALKEVVGLVQAIGKSFMEVWTNGTGQRFIENLLILLADVLSIIGDIAGAFRRAWEDDGRGTALIQSIFDLWNRILELLHLVAQAFRDAWNDGTGESIAANLLEIFTNIFKAVGNIAEQLKKAWAQGNTGKEIFSIILGVINTLLEHINKITQATEEWDRTLDFTPLLNSVKKLLESLQPLADNLGAGLEWFYKNVLLPLAGFTIEKLIPAFLDTLSGALKAINGVIEGSKPAFEFLWEKILKPAAEWTGGVIVEVLKKIGDALSVIGDWISKHSEGFSNFIVLVGSFATALLAINVAIGIWNVVAGIAAGITTALGIAVEILMSPFTLIVLAIAAVVAIGVILYKNWDTIMEKAGELGAWIGEKWNDLTRITGEVWESIKQLVADIWAHISSTFSNVIESFVQFGKDIWEGLKKGLNSIIEGVETFFHDYVWKPITDCFKKLFGIHSPSTVFADFGGFLMEGLFNGIKSLVFKPLEALGGFFTSAKEKTKEAWGNIKKWTADAWSNVGTTIGGAVDKSKQWVSSKWSDVKKATSGAWDNIKSWTSKAWTGTKKSVSEAVDTAKTAVSKGWSTVGEKTSSTWNKVAGSTTKAWHGTNRTILDKTREIARTIENAWNTIKSSTNRTWSAVYSTIVNHAYNVKNKASNAFWILKNNLVNSLGGLKSIVASTFNSIAHWANQLPYRIARGLSNGVQAIRNAASSIARGMVNIVGSAVNSVVNGINWVLRSVGAGSYALSGWGIPSYAKGTGAHPGGLALVNDAPGINYQEAYQTPDGKKGVFPKIRNMLVYLPKGSSVLDGQRTSKLTSDIPAYSHGVGHWFNERWDRVKAISSDIWSYDSDPSKLLSAAISKYIQLNNVGQPNLAMSKGSIATTANGSEDWMAKKYNESYQKHMDTLSSVNGGDWAKQIKRAARLMHQSITNTEVNGILAQIQRESGGNQRIIQSSAVWDVNTASGNPAKGLLQYIPQTFAAYKVPGYGDIFNGFHQLMAFFNNSNWRYDLPYGHSGWGPSGHRIVGYENGGWINQEGLYRLGEGNKRELIIPMEKPTIAQKLIEEAIDYLGIDWTDTSLSMPEVFKPTAFTKPNLNLANDKTTCYEGSGMQQNMESMLNGVMLAIRSIGGTPQQAPNGDIVVEIGGEEFARIAISKINEYNRKLGYNALEI
ncbi:TPA: phage tail protein [Enterococcus faecalis]